MKELKPKFMLTRVYDDGSHDKPEIAPLSKVIDEAKMNRRRFFGAGLAASAALLLIDSCSIASKQTMTRQTRDRPLDKECGKTYAHCDDVTRLAVSGNGAILASGSKDNSVKCWNLLNQALIQTFKSDSSPRIALSPDGTMIAYSISDSNNELRSLPFGKLIKTFAGQCYGFSPDSGRLIVGNKGFIDIHHLSGDSVSSKPASGLIEAIAVSPAGDYIAVGIENKGVKLFDNEGNEVKTLTGNYPSGELVFSPDGQSLAVVRIKSQNSTKKMATIFSVYGLYGDKLFEMDQNLRNLVFSPDGKWLFWATSQIQALNTDSFELQTLHTIANELVMIPASDGKFIITGGRNGSVKMWFWRPQMEFFKCFMDVNCSGKQSKGSMFNYTDEWGRILSYTLPCGSPLPAGATCTCNCVPGKMEGVCTCDRVCTCNKVKVCTCDTVRTCSCLSVGSRTRTICTCNLVYR
jgi:WD40 repeat protein